jgi:hypothetical protein
VTCQYPIKASPHTLGIVILPVRYIPKTMNNLIFSVFTDIILYLDIPFLLTYVIFYPMISVLLPYSLAVQNEINKIQIHSNAWIKNHCIRGQLRLRIKDWKRRQWVLESSGMSSQPRSWTCAPINYLGRWLRDKLIWTLSARNNYYMLLNNICTAHVKWFW